MPQMRRTASLFALKLGHARGRGWFRELVGSVSRWARWGLWYLTLGDDEVHGYSVDARAIRPTDTSRELFEALFLEWPVTERTQVTGIATLRFPLWPTDRVVAAMGGNTPAEQAITKGPILDHPPFDGRGMVRLPGYPIAALSYVEPTRLRAGGQFIKHEADGSPESLIATYAYVHVTGRGSRLDDGGWGLRARQ